MKTVQLRPHQIQAISAIRSALQRKQKNILVEMANGCGKSLVLAKTVEELCKTGSQKILILVDRLENKQLIKNALFKNDRDIFDFDPHTLSIETVQYVLKQSTVKYNEFQFVIFFRYTHIGKSL